MAENWSSAEIAHVTESLEKELAVQTLVEKRMQEAIDDHRKRQRVEEASSSSGHQTPSSTVGKVILNTKQLAVKKVEPYVFANEQSVKYDCGDIIAHSRNR